MVFVIVFVHQKGFSVILSDMCPLVSGITSKDAALSLELGMQALDLAVGGAALANPSNEPQVEESVDGATTSSDDNGVLKRGGHLVIKLLESEDVQGLVCPKTLFGNKTGNYRIAALFGCLIDCLFAVYFVDFNRICKPLFRKASLLRPKATRSSSREIYLICQGLQSQAKIKN